MSHAVLEEPEPPPPAARGPLSAFLLDRLAHPAHELGASPAPAGDPLGDEDECLALYLCYELHYRGLAGVDVDWEWEPSLLGLRRGLERRLERRLRDEVPPVETPPSEIPQRLRALPRSARGPSVSRYLETRGTLDQLREFLVHRSAYQLKEADPHSWAIPRLIGPAKVALVEIQADEYGGGRPERQHARLFAGSMRALGLDDRYGAHLDLITGVTLATVNLVSLFGLHRRWRGALVGHLALLEIDSSLPNRRYANALRRLGADPAATVFFDEHVEADAVHEAIAAHDLAGAFAVQEPALAGDILFGALALMALDRRLSSYLLGQWDRGNSSLRAPLRSL